MSELFTTPIDASTRFCAVYGHPIRHSASPAMQNAGMAALGLNWRYLAFDVHPDNLLQAIAGAKAMQFVGLNLTVPHKVLAVPMVDLLDESARAWGAVNTIRFEAKDEAGGWRPLGFATDAKGGSEGAANLSATPSQAWLRGAEGKEVRSQGFNTDADAIARALREDLGLKLANMRVLALGAGGAGRVAALKLAAEGVAELFLLNRTASKAEELAREIRERFPRVKTAVGCPVSSIDLLLNATSLGLKPEDGVPLDERAFPLSRAGAVFDMIYRPAETPLLKAAKAAGCRVANGLGMLLYQGAKALEIWTGQPAPLAVMRAALEKNVYV